MKKEKPEIYIVDIQSLRDLPIEKQVEAVIDILKLLEIGVTHEVYLGLDDNYKEHFKPKFS